MSVQAGIWNFDGAPVKRDALLGLNQTVADYGPDGEVMYFDGPLGMLFRPFHTTRESRLEQQPYRSFSGVVVTWDGRLDNRSDLIAQLSATLQNDTTDVALVAAAFERWNTDCFAHITGDWAIAIWVPREKELLLARDYAGIRHLFYYPKATSVAWCTHLEGLALSGDQFTLCDSYFAGYIAIWPEAHLTPYREIHSVPPGQFARFRKGKVSIHSYWLFDPRYKTRYKTDAEYEEHFRSLFRQSVRQRLRTDSPVLADLSGGLDSSSVVCMADDIRRKEGIDGLKLDTFSFLVLDEPGEEDPPYIQSVEKWRRQIGHRREIRQLGETSPFEYATFVATPGFGGRPEQNAAKAEVIADGKYRVILSGTGGDEMLGQVLDPRVQLADTFRRLQIKEFAEQLHAWSLLLRRPLLHLFWDALYLQLPVAIRARVTGSAKADSWLNANFAKRQNLSFRQLDLAEGSWFWPPSVRDSLHTLLTLTRQMTKTRPSREETRYPFLDQKLVEFLLSIPTEQLLRPGHRRSLMRRALADLLPPEILMRRTKSVSGRYHSAILQKHWGELECILRSPLISRLGYVDRHKFVASLAEAKNGNLSPYFLRLSRALSWELWLRQAVTRGVVSIPPEIARTIRTPPAKPLACLIAQAHLPGQDRSFAPGASSAGETIHS
jgi:asparagine synthase (glutamine-hydrolysing)